MPAVLGLQIDDVEQASTARQLLRTHLCLVCVGAGVGILGVIQYVIVKDAVASLQESTGQTPTNSRANAGIVSLIIWVVLPFLCPALAFVMARSAISGNNQGLLQGICFFDGCCSLCTFILGIVSIFTFLGYTSLKTWAESLSCDDDGQDFDSIDQCEKATKGAANVFNIVAIVGIVMAVLWFIGFVACTFATFKANSAQTSLRMQMVFTGPPRMPQVVYVGGMGPQVVGGQMINTVVYSGAVVGGPCENAVVGRPVEYIGQATGGPVIGQAVMGQVVQATLVQPP